MNNAHENTHDLRIVLLALVLAAGATACAGGSDDEDTTFEIASTNVATSTSTTIRISGKYIAFLAAEDATSTGGNPTDLNQDGDVADQVAHVVDTVSGEQFRLGVAARDLAWAGSELYLVVDEALDMNDWNVDADETDSVLLHWSAASPTLVFVDELQPAAAVSAIGLDTRLVYAALTPTAGTGGSNLRFLEPTSPTTPIPIATVGLPGIGPVSARLLGEDEKLVFLAFADEAGRDLNADGDVLDTTVLGLLDGTDSASVARSTGLAVDAASPRRAKTIAAGNWRVGFLVSEAGQGATNRNPSSLSANFRPSQCSLNDTDATDQVLAVLTFAAWDGDPLANPPINHGLAGRDRIVFAGNAVGTIVSEADDNCDLNDDMDTTDRVVRWMPIATTPLSPIAPVNDADQIRALFDAPGGGHGLYELSNRFVIVSSEEDGGDVDVNGAIDANLVAWMNPSSLPNAWDFFHGSSGTQVVEASWVSARESENRLGVAFTERIGGVSLNQGTTEVPGDNDLNDSVPTFPTFSSNRLIFPGVQLCLDRDSSGITTARGWSFYRVSEAEDARDTNGDGDETDFILERTNLTTGATFGMSVASNVQRDVVEVSRFGSAACGALIASEAQQGASGTDFNGDGDKTDVVLRWFRF